MRPQRALALLLMSTLLLAMTPWGRGEGCRLCGQLGRCCCFTRLAARPAAAPHCKAMGTACAMGRSAERPAALRAPQTLPERTGAFAALEPPPPGAPEPTGRVTAAGVRLPSPFFASPPTPPPHAVRFV